MTNGKKTYAIPWWFVTILTNFKLLFNAIERKNTMLDTHFDLIKAQSQFNEIKNLQERSKNGLILFSEHTASQLSPITEPATDLDQFKARETILNNFAEGVLTSMLSAYRNDISINFKRKALTRFPFGAHLYHPYWKTVICLECEGIGLQFLPENFLKIFPNLTSFNCKYNDLTSLPASLIEKFGQAWAEEMLNHQGANHPDYLEQQRQEKLQRQQEEQARQERKKQLLREELALERKKQEQKFERQYQESIRKEREKTQQALKQHQEKTEQANAPYKQTWQTIFENISPKKTAPEILSEQFQQLAIQEQAPTYTVSYDAQIRSEETENNNNSFEISVKNQMI